MTRAASRRTGVVLAAGFGSRLARDGEEGSLKPLTPVAGVPLIERTLSNLARAGCERVAIVLGYRANEIEAEIRRAHSSGVALQFVHNPDYAKSNGLSVLAAAPLIEDTFVLVMADHVLGDSLMDIARDHMPPENGVSLLVDYKLGRIFDMEDATKVRVKDKRIVAIGKHMVDYNCIDTGVFVCTRGLLEALEAVKSEKGDASLSDGIQRLAAAGRMEAVDIGDGFWQDVDTPEMLAYAERTLSAGT